MNSNDNPKNGAYEVPGLLIPRTGLLTMSRNFVERAAALVLNRLNPAWLMECRDPNAKKFLFRAFYVPLYSVCVIGFGTTRLGITPLLLHEYAEYALAMERMMLEIVMRRGLGKLKNQRPQSLLDLLSDPTEGYAFWLKRFEEWKASANKSYRHFIRKQAPDTKKGGLKARAAFLGNMLQRAGKLPVDLLDVTLREVARDESAFNAFCKNALKPKPARWGEPELDTWLLEVWPLITMYSWNYYDVWLVAIAKWGDDADGKRALGKPSTIEDRCKKMLNLHLGPGGREKQGRPEKIPEWKEGQEGNPSPTPMPAFAPIALSLESIGIAKEKWVLGGSFIKALAKVHVPPN